MLHVYGLFLGTVRNTQTPFHASFLAFPCPSHPTLGNHEARNPFFMLHFWPSQTIPTTLLGTMKHPNFSFGLFLHMGTMRNTQNPSHASFLAFQTIPTTLLGTVRNTHPVFMLYFLTTILGNHEKHPNPFSCSFFAFRNPSHPTLGSHEAPKPLFMLHFSVSKPFPPHSWEP